MAIASNDIAASLSVIRVFRGKTCRSLAALGMTAGGELAGSGYCGRSQRRLFAAAKIASMTLMFAIASSMDTGTSP